MKKGLKQIENDVVFINPENNRSECSFNECASKFNIKGVEEKNILNYWKDGTKITYNSYYTKCHECDRKISTKSNQTKTENSREESIRLSYLNSGKDKQENIIKREEIIIS
jgi:hypothetical protein